MQISSFPNLIISHDNKIKRRQQYNCLSPLACDVVSFGSIKKHSLDSFQLVCSNVHRAPLEKFDSGDEFNCWAQNKLDMLYNSDYCGRSSKVSHNRREILKDWKSCLRDKDSYYLKNPALSLLIYGSLVKGLTPDSDKLPVSLNKIVLAQTVDQLKERIKDNRKIQFDFVKEYNLNLIKHYSFPKRGWVKIPSYKNDRENFMDNVQKLSVISAKTWCTKNEETHTYLANGDFYIYLDDYEPMVGIRLENDKVKEIQGPRNNSKIPQEYIDQVEEVVHENKITGADNYIQKARLAQQERRIILEDIGQEIKNRDYSSILKYFGIEFKELEDGTLNLSKYNQPSDNTTYRDLGIDEKAMFRNVSVISGSANFSRSSLNSLEKLRYIGGRANFSGSHIQDLGPLKIIGESAWFDHSALTCLGNLEVIGGAASFSHSNIVDLGNLKEIKGSVWFCDCKLSQTYSLEKIGGDAFAKYSKIRDFSRVKISGDLK